MGRTEKVLNYLLDQSHRWAGADPERGPNFRPTWVRKNELFRSIKKSSREAREKVDNDKNKGLLARDSKI